jgi:hypothetical protein
MNRQEQFVRELQDLLHKYDVSMRVEEDASERAFVNFWSYSVFEGNEMVHDRIDFSTRYMDGSQSIVLGK